MNPMLAMVLGLTLFADNGCSRARGASEREDNPGREEQSVLPANARAPEVLFDRAGRDPVRVRVELATNDRDRARGLMYRERLGENDGMLFLFDAPEHLSFWMHNTYLPLDMIFITSDMRILGIVENAEPRTDTPREVVGESQYVLEVNAGFARRHGLTSGMQVRFENITARGVPRGGA